VAGFEVPIAVRFWVLINNHNCQTKLSTILISSL